MLGRAIWDKLLECIFEHFEIARVKSINHVINNKSKIKLNKINQNSSGNNNIRPEQQQQQNCDLRAGAGQRSNQTAFRHLIWSFL